MCSIIHRILYRLYDKINGRVSIQPSLYCICITEPKYFRAAIVTKKMLSGWKTISNKECDKNPIHVSRIHDYNNKHQHCSELKYKIILVEITIHLTPCVRRKKYLRFLLITCDTSTRL